MIGLVSAEVDDEEEFLNLVANVQGSRLHNQRANFVRLNADPQRSDATSNRDKCKDGLYNTLLKQQVNIFCIYLVYLFKKCTFFLKDAKLCVLLNSVQITFSACAFLLLLRLVRIVVSCHT